MKYTVLKKTAIKYFQSAEDQLNKNRFNSAVVLYFKSLVALVDLFILQKIETTVSSHNKRFKLTKKRFPEIYNLLDKDFPFYQDSYVHIMSKELALVIKDDAQTMAKKTKIKLF